MICIVITGLQLLFQEILPIMNALNTSQLPTSMFLIRGKKVSSSHYLYSSNKFGKYLC